jgi:hypothetical protein
MAKHANPLFQKEHGFQLQDNYVIAMHGPDVSEPAIRTTWFALEYAAGCALTAMLSFMFNHTQDLPPDVRADLTYRLHHIGESRLALGEKAMERWGTEDPFPGKWRV